MQTVTDATRSANKKAQAVCVLGMHRSGTSTVTRALNLLGASLGDNCYLMPPLKENPEGFWERLDIVELNTRMLKQLGRNWDTTRPLPEQWTRCATIAPLKEELQHLVAKNFADKPLWLWKDPRTCLLLPLWKEKLRMLNTDLRCVFVVRSPLDVANSLCRRNHIPRSKALGIWFNYCVTALKDAADVPKVFIRYDQLVESWESPLRDCAKDIGICWPTEDQSFHLAMNTFIRRDLRHHQSNDAALQTAPYPVRRLYEMMVGACGTTILYNHQFNQEVNLLDREFRNYASFFVGDLNNSAVDSRPLIRRTLSSWQRSWKKRLAPFYQPEVTVNQG